jgi:diguanylate cyclase (GGDEF)-like protein
MTMTIDTARQLSARNFGEVRSAIRIIRRFERLRFRFAAAAAGICCLALAGYLLDLRMLYLPVEEGGGTHPLTALTALLLALGRCASNRRFEFALASLAAALLGLRGIELLWLETPMPVGQWLGMFTWDSAPRGETAMGFNSLGTFAAIALAILLGHRSALGMAAIVAAFGVCCTVIVAYSYALHPAFGGMSPITTLIALLLMLATVGRHIDPLALRLLLSDSAVSRLLRRQLLLALSGFWIGGLLLLQLHPAQWITAAPLFTTVMLVLAIAGLISTVAMLADTENTRQRQQATLERLSVTDALTGLSNRWACDVFASRAIAAAQREGTGLAVVLIDIDRFKSVNDRYGHAAGDRLLCEVGHLLPRWLRRSDLAARWGGEEFLLILTTTRLTGAIALAERVRRCFEDRLSLPDGSMPVTASIGCAEMLTGEETLDAAISRADAALYRAKNAGRNRVEPRLPTLEAGSDASPCEESNTAQGRAPRPGPRRRRAADTVS